ncbi:aromatic-L-amino-acid decarboxylase-like isoform X1 [Branchiostoma lanceolatum]|uniref:aromatic-L-amino-acid decarboxylase-like isoform X1 n=1 Tax=Branchiostoma lanceolatum TaxID=7740 RepID=UPI003455AFD8
MVDYIADYLQTVHTRRVYPDVQPGYMRSLVPDSAPMDGESWEDIFDDVERVIMPGVVHWQSPHMHAYYPALNSGPSLLGDMLADAIGCIGFTWASSPACTELEMIVMDWLGKMIGLPPQFLYELSDGKGGGVIQGTVSEATLVSMLAARAEAVRKLKEQVPDAEESDITGRLVAYCSDQAHSQVQKNCVVALVKLRQLDTDEKGRMRGADLQKAIDQDRQEGLIPFFVCATLGSTGACTFDSLEEIGPICDSENIWLHIDAAYAGTAFICPEYRYLMKGIELAHSFAFNPSKWMMVHFDCTAMWVKDNVALQQAFIVNPLYLRHENSGHAVDYMHWQIPLSRRFRALKLWFVIRSYGVMGLRDHVRKGVRLAEQFETMVRKDTRFEIPAQRILGLVVFRLKGPDSLTEALLNRLNKTGKLFMVPASLKGKYIIRFTVTSQNTAESDIEYDFELIQKMASHVLSGNEAEPDMAKWETETFVSKVSSAPDDSNGNRAAQRAGRRLDTAVVRVPSGRRTVIVKIPVKNQPKQDGGRPVEKDLANICGCTSLLSSLMMNKDNKELQNSASSSAKDDAVAAAKRRAIFEAKGTQTSLECEIKVMGNGLLSEAIKSLLLAQLQIKCLTTWTVTNSAQSTWPICIALVNLAHRSGQLGTSPWSTRPNTLVNSAQCRRQQSRPKDTHTDRKTRSLLKHVHVLAISLRAGIRNKLSIKIMLIAYAQAVWDFPNLKVNSCKLTVTTVKRLKVSKNVAFYFFNTSI